MWEAYRLTVQLLEADSSLILWNHRFDLPTIAAPSDDQFAACSACKARPPSIYS